MPTGTSTIDFGSFPGANEASVAVTGQTSILSNSVAEAYIMSEASANRTANDHRYVGLYITLTCGDVVAGTGFTIYARSLDKMTGQYSIRWVWA